MTAAQVEIQLIASIVAIACALPGVFLVLRRMAMMSDAISHTVLLGIVLMFFAIKTLDSPLLIFGAAAIGVLTVGLVELLSKSKLVKQDAAIGLVFPALFSIAVILISKFARGVHLDSDAVLLGELAFTPFDRVMLFGIDLPHSLVVMGIILMVNNALIFLFYKELKLATFDPGLASALGFSPALINYGLMTTVSVTAVGAFDAVGSVLVVALMIGPAATAYLLTDNLTKMLWLSALSGVGSAISGYWLARALDANIAGAMATTIGLIFLITFLFAPNRGMVALALRRRRQRWEFAQTMLIIHLLHHETRPNAEEESQFEHLMDHMSWAREFAGKVVSIAQNNDIIKLKNGRLSLTDAGRQIAKESMSN
jgi:manganese/zinc/iron transport system permease protein